MASGSGSGLPFSWWHQGEPGASSCSLHEATRLVADISRHGRRRFEGRRAGCLWLLIII